MTGSSAVVVGGYPARPWPAHRANRAAIIALAFWLGLGTALAGGVVVSAGLAWWRRRWSLSARLGATIIALAAVAFTWFLTTWNLLGFRV